MVGGVVKVADGATVGVKDAVTVGSTCTVAVGTGCVAVLTNDDDARVAEGIDVNAMATCVATRSEGGVVVLLERLHADNNITKPTIKIILFLISLPSLNLQNKIG
jgi:hypothetical protein